MNAQDVADYLQQHPEFFTEHASLFASMTVPHPHGGRAIPLAERQMITLREKNRALELKVAELMRFGQENDAIAERLARWTRMLLLQRAPRLLPETLTGSLEEIFSVPHVALVLWEAADDYALESRASDATPAVVAYVKALGEPFCGEARGDAGAVVSLFGRSRAADAPDASTGDGVDSAKAEEAGADVRSLAVIPLRRGAAPDAFGVLVLGSADARRFHAGMGTDFLARIGENSSAALTRLLK